MQFNFLFGFKLGSKIYASLFTQDTEVIVWDIVGERGLHRLSGHKGAITQALFMAGHDVLISSAKDSFVKFWDLETAHCFKTLTAHKAEVRQKIKNNNFIFVSYSNFLLL